MEKETSIWYFGLTWGEQGRVVRWLRDHKPPKGWKWSHIDFAFLNMPHERTPLAESYLGAAVLRKKFQIDS